MKVPTKNLECENVLEEQPSPQNAIVFFVLIPKTNKHEKNLAVD